MADQQIIGQYFVTANDNKMKIVFNDSVKDSKGVKEKLNLTLYSIRFKTWHKSRPTHFP